MNHDQEHCADFRKSRCPKRCYRARLTRELFEMKARGELAGVPMSFAHFKGTDACPRDEGNNPSAPSGHLPLHRGGTDK